MACPRALFRMPFDIQVTSTADILRLLGREITIVGADAFDFALTVSRQTGLARVVPVAATMVARPDRVDTILTANGGYATVQGTTHHVVDLSTTTGHFLAQIGVVANLSSGTTPGYVTGYVDAYISQCMTMIGQRGIEISGQSDATTPNYYILGRVPARSAGSLRAAIIAEGVNVSEFRFMVRGVNDPDAPTAWTPLGTGFTTLANGSSAVCFADASVSGITPANYHELDFAIAIQKQAIGSNPTGRLKVSAGLSYT